MLGCVEGTEVERMATHGSGESGQPVPSHLPHPHHTADPAALEDPVHHDVAEHELEEEAASDEDDADADGGDAAYVDAADGAADGSGWPPAAEATGDERVDAAVERLREVSEMPASEHVGVYEDVHRRLQDSLAELDGS
jgi:hypothetical protein